MGRAGAESVISLIAVCCVGVKIRQDCRRGVLRLTCLPESLRVKFGTARTTVVSTAAQNPSNNANNNVTLLLPLLQVT